MPRGYRFVVFATLGFVASVSLISVGIAWVLWPPSPLLPDYNWQETSYSNYQSDAGSCDPAKIRALSTDRERARKSESCEADAEQHRLQTNDLIQQTRAANAATQAIYIAVWQSRSMVLGLIIGLFTLSAAVAAAIFAKRAADETKRSADISRDALAHSETTFLSQNSPAIYLEDAKFLDSAKAYGVSLRFKNFGQAPAKNVLISIAYKFEARPITEELGEQNVQVLSVLPQGHTRALTVSMHSERTLLDLVKQAKLMLVIDVTFSYRDSLSHNVEQRETVVFDGQDIGYGVGRQITAFDISDFGMPEPEKNI